MCVSVELLTRLRVMVFSVRSSTDGEESLQLGVEWLPVNSSEAECFGLSTGFTCLYASWVRFDICSLVFDSWGSCVRSRNARIVSLNSPARLESFSSHCEAVRALVKERKASLRPLMVQWSCSTWSLRDCMVSSWRCLNARWARRVCSRLRYKRLSKWKGRVSPQ